MDGQATFSLDGESLETKSTKVKGDPSLLEKCFHHGCHYNPPDDLCHFYNALTPCEGCTNWRSCDREVLKKLRWKKTFIDHLDYTRLMRKRSWKDLDRSVKARKSPPEKTKPSRRSLLSFDSRD